MSQSNGNGYRITIRFPSGAIEHRYGSSLPQVGEEIGVDGQSGFVTEVAEHGDGDVSVQVGRRPPARRAAARDANPDPAA
jgi:hypothetical protein